ncbi:hypothetical protein LZ554_000922 [Drepanopeziza brunnea f. sp. 'monogermtubi']|nr:hypothetical protein LZ554_000922 [Drepanopeziza brunnea f. sp. 'monogermtubi']
MSVKRSVDKKRSCERFQVTVKSHAGLIGSSFDVNFSGVDQIYSSSPFQVLYNSGATRPLSKRNSVIDSMTCISW